MSATQKLVVQIQKERYHQYYKVFSLNMFATPFNATLCCVVVYLKQEDEQELFMAEKWVTIAQYADSEKITYEAARKKVELYAKDLAEHIKEVPYGKGKRTKRMLDEYACDWLSNHVANKTVILRPEDDPEVVQLREHNQNLQEMNQNLLVQVAQLQKQLLDEREARIADKDEIKKLQDEKIQLIESGNKEKEEKRIQELEKQLQDMQSREEERQSKIAELESREEARKKAGFFKRLLGKY